MNGSIPFFVYDAQDAEGFRSSVLELMGLVTPYSYEVIGEEVDPFIADADLALALENDHAMLVLVPLE